MTNMMALATNCAMAVAVVPVVLVLATDEEGACEKTPVPSYLKVLVVFKCVFACLHLGSGLGKPGDLSWRYSIMAIYVSILFYTFFLFAGGYWFYTETNVMCLDSSTFLMMRCAMLDQLIFPICSCWLWAPRVGRYDIGYDDEDHPFDDIKIS